MEQYLAVLAFALPAALLFRVYSTLNQALGKPQLVTWLQVASLFIKVPLSIWFTLGGAGLPAQGVVGCAWATLLVNYTMLALAVWLLRTQSICPPLQLWRPLERPHAPTLSGFLQLGVPAGLAIMVEVTSFTLMALFIARQGTTAAAAHQIAANMAALLYMVPLSLAIATSTRVSYWLGAGQALRAQRVVYIGFRLAALTGIALAAILFIANQEVCVCLFRQPRRGRCGVRAAAVGGGLSPGGCIANAVRLRAAKLSHHRRPLGGVLRIAVGAGAGRRLPGGLQQHGRVEQHGSITRCVLGVQCLGTASTAAAFMAMLAKAAAQVQRTTHQRRRFAGKVTEKVEPLPSSLVISSDAPWRCSTCFTMASPRPVPPVSRERLRSTR